MIEPQSEIQNPKSEMALTLAQYQTRVGDLLYDSAHSVYPTDQIDAGVRQALEAYTRAVPLAMETVLTLPGDGHEIAIDSLTDLITVTAAWWPYDSTADEVWPPNRVKGFQVFWDDARPVLILSSDTEDQPQEDDEIRLWYTTRHTIQNLDSAAATTVPDEDEELLVLGAASYTVLARVLNEAQSTTTDIYHMEFIQAWGEARLGAFNSALAALKRITNRGNAPALGNMDGWALDKWDTSRDN